MEKPADNPVPSKEETPAQKHASHRAVWFILGFVVLLGVLAFFGIMARFHQTSELKQAASQHVPRVTVVHPQTTPAVVNAVLPGETEAFIEAPIFAQTNGYLKKWYHDIGDRVKAGDALGELDTPTVDQQLQQAQAQLSESQASFTLAQATYSRQQVLLKTNVISKQDFDNATGDLRTKQSAVNSEIANVNQLKAQQDFKVLHAPFDGIVSARNTDVGALINSSTTTPLFVVSQLAPLRVYIQVPETLASMVKIGEKADLTFDTFPGRVFPAEVVATAGTIDASSRTLRTQLSVPNKTEELFPGAYTQVTLHLTNSTPSITVPANVLLFRSEGASVGVVDADGKVEIRKVKIGKDLGATLEIVDGVKVDDEVIVNPSDSLAPGDHVEIAADPAPAASPAKS